MPTDPLPRAVGRIAWIAIGCGLLLIVVALGWWARFYGAVVAQDAQGSLADAVSCIYSSRGTCGFIAGIARAAGRMAYSPTVFWLGISAFLAGTVTRVWLMRAV